MTIHNLFNQKISGENVNKSMVSNTSVLRAIDLFAGIGGIRKGFFNVFRQNIDFVFSSEIDKHAQKTYYLNYRDVPHGDITKIKEQDIPPHDIILAGFPCQAFSVAGYRKGFEDTRGTLFFDVARIAKYHRPKIVFLENVKGFAGHDNGKTFKIVKQTLEDIGYKIFYSILNSKDFDIPQNRERIYIVGFLDDNVNFRFPSIKKPKKSIHDMLDSKIDNRFYYNDKPLYEKIKNEVVCNSTIYQWRRKYIRENKSGVCPTLTANMGTGGHNVPIIKDDKGIRKLTPEECVRFQGFDDAFMFPKDLALSHQYKQAGNSVTVTVVEEIAKEIKNVL
jgi:DNA (cytosine-5)-methyltransferase 1